MSLEIFEPRTCIDPGAAIVLLNHVGSTVHQDTGRDANALANSFGIHVIAADRPGTAGFFPHPGLADKLCSPSGYVTEVAKLGKSIDSQLDQLGVKRTLLTGRSAGGLGALALTRSETISSQRSVFAADPVACEQMSVKSGSKRFRDYNKLQRQIQEDTQDDCLVKPLPPELNGSQRIYRAANMIPAFLYDKYHNKRIWASAATLEYAKHIALFQTRIAATIEFAERSLTVTELIYNEQVRDIQLLRTNGAQFEIRRSENTTHASYDNREFMTRLLLPAVANISDTK